jgi:hypothetical protein
MRKLLVLLVLACFSFAIIPAAPARANLTNTAQPLVKKHHHKHHHHKHKKPA